MYKLFMENHVVLFKVHPVIEYIGGIVLDAFKPLIEQGFLQVVYGGAEEGAIYAGMMGSMKSI